MKSQINFGNLGGGGSSPKYSFSGVYRQSIAGGNLEIDYTAGTYDASGGAGDKCDGAINLGTNQNSITIKKEGIYDILIYSNGALVHQGQQEHVTANTTYSFTVGNSVSTQLTYTILVY